MGFERVGGGVKVWVSPLTRVVALTTLALPCECVISIEFQRKLKISYNLLRLDYERLLNIFKNEFAVFLSTHWSGYHLQRFTL